MRKFDDAAGQSWRIVISTPDLKRVREALQVNLLDLDGETFTRLLQDPETLVDVLAELLAVQIGRMAPTEDEAAERWEAEKLAGVTQPAESRAKLPGLSGDEFAGRLRGDAIDRAASCLLEALIDFFPNRRRMTLRAALEKTNEMLDRTAEHAVKLVQSGQMETLLANTMAEMEANLADAVRRSTPGKRSTDGPATSELIPTE